VNYATHIEVGNSHPSSEVPPQPVLETPRLRLRPFTLRDACDVQRLAGDREVSSTTRLIPHPYPDGLAEQWIASLDGLYAKGRSASFAITLHDGTLMGAVGLSIEPADRHAELGYWIGRPYWNRGYCTEAARAAVRFAFETLELQRIFAHYIARNPASGRVMEKLGMRREGCLRQHRFKAGEYQDLMLCGLLKHEFGSVGP
jgi:ribosomal-protein-alanine N-acetyltransferase